MRAFPLAMSVLIATSAAAQEAAPPRPLPGNSAAYPETARSMGVVGEVRFTAEVDATGAVTAVTIRSVPFTGYGFEDAVTTAVRAWRFEPARAEGRPVAARYDGAVNFRLRPEDETALRALASHMIAAWNARDAEGVAALFGAEDALVRPQEGPTVKGAKPVAEWVRSRLAQPAPRLAEAPGGIRFVAADAAFVLLPLRAEGPAASVSDTDESWAVLVVKHAEQGWRIVRFDAGAADPTPLRIGGPIKEPRKLKHHTPYYPEEAKQARIQGVVVLECTIGPEGNVQHVRVLRGVPQLNGPAIDAVRKWVYTPTLLDGRPVPVIMTVTVSFRLQ
jgi:uncharacterized protein (TIGR02246 family)